MSNSNFGRRAFLAGGIALTGCGYLIHPERRGQRGGEADAPILVVDLLWLIPGLIPGVVCLIVDFSTGCIYKNGSRAARERLPASKGGATAAVTVDGAVVATAAVEHDRQASLRWTENVHETTLRERGRVVLRRPDGVTAEAFVRDLI